MSYFVFGIKTWLLIIFLPIVSWGCSGSDVSRNESELPTEQYLKVAEVSLAENRDQKELLAQLSSLLETVRESKNHAESLTKQEQAEIDALLANINDLQNNPEAVRQIEALKSNLTELKGMDKSQISFDIDFIQKP